ncbi:hypothetical protein DV736_g5467, partial [Chaetothyriales sp. CBS 134916]
MSYAITEEPRRSGSTQPFSHQRPVRITLAYSVDNVVNCVTFLMATWTTLTEKSSSTLFNVPSVYAMERGGELFEARASWVLHVARKHTAHDIDSMICMCAPCNEASLEPGISNSRRVKRVKVKELEPELDVEAGLPDLPHRECSYPSPPTSDETSENWDLFSEEDVIMFTPQGQSLTWDPFDQKDKRRWVEDGLEPKDALEVVELEDIPIDPYLLALG